MMLRSFFVKVKSKNLKFNSNLLNKLIEFFEHFRYNINYIFVPKLYIVNKEYWY